MDLPVGSVFSLFPMGDVAATSEGLLYPLDGLAFRPDGQIGTSNAVTGPVCVGVDGPKMLVILPRGALGAVIEVLAHAERWSAL
jgi:thiamine pyrophosphokinase